MKMPPRASATPVPCDRHRLHRAGVRAGTREGYAAVSQLLPDSVGTEQLQDGAVTSKKIRNFTLRRWDFRQSDFPPVPNAEILLSATLRIAKPRSRCRQGP